MRLQPGFASSQDGRLRRMKKNSAYRDFHHNLFLLLASVPILNTAVFVCFLWIPRNNLIMPVSLLFCYLLTIFSPSASELNLQTLSHSGGSL